MSVVIDNDVPLPKRLGKKAKWPWRQLQIGQSFVLTSPDGESANGQIQKAQRQYGIRLKRRQIEEGLYRIWRVE